MPRRFAPRFNLRRRRRKDGFASSKELASIKNTVLSLVSPSRGSLFRSFDPIPPGTSLALSLLAVASSDDNGEVGVLRVAKRLEILLCYVFNWRLRNDEINRARSHLYGINGSRLVFLAFTGSLPRSITFVGVAVSSPSV